MNLQARMRYREATVICRASIFSLMLMAYPAAAQEGNVQETDAESAPPPLEEIVVKGYQRSIESSVIARRNRTNFGDTIFAEDIGKFAEQNLAESIQRISGVAIRRVNGEGLDVTLRGLGPSFTRVLLNGAPVSTASIGFRQGQNRNRQFDFDIFPSELFTQIQVEKTQKASNTEGGIAGVINMRNHRPFDFDEGWTFGYTAEGVYREFNEEVDPAGSALVSWVSPERKFGVVVGAALRERSYDNEAFESKAWNDAASGQIDWKGDADPASVNLADDPDGLRGPNLLELNPGMSAEDLQNARLPRLPRTGRNAGTRDRSGGILAAQWAPTSDLQFNLDTIFSNLDERRMRVNQDAFLRGLTAETITPFNLEINEFDTVVSGTFTGVDRRNENRLVETDTEFHQIALSADWQVNDFIHQDFLVSYSESTFERPIEISAIPIINDSDFVFEIQGGRGVPSIGTEVDQSTIPQAFFDFLDAQPDLTADDFFNPVDLNNPNDFVLDNIRSGPLFITDENLNFRWNVRFGDEENNIRIGVAYDEFEREELDGDFTLSVAEVLEAAGLDPDNPPPVEAFVADENSTDPSRGTPLPGDFLQGLNPPQGAVTSHIVVDFNKFDELLSTGDMSGLELIKSLTTLNPSGSGLATEETWSGYLEANVSTEFMNRPLRVNTGLRVTRTEVTTQSFVPGVGLGFPFFDGPAPAAVGVPIFDKSQYIEPLPSLNLVWLFHDNLQFRFAIGRALTRPDIGSMIPQTSVDVGEVRTGNASLEPFLSDQIDVGLEWYPFRRSILTTNFFWKDVKNFIEDGVRRGEFRESGVPISTLDPQDFQFLTPDTIVDFLQPVNSAQNRIIMGVETAIVMPLDFLRLPEGFLFSGNHTWVDSTELQTQEAVQVTTGIIGLSENTFNITGSYESDLFAARLSFNWRDGFVESECCVAGQPELFERQEAGQLDLNASLNLCHGYLLGCDQDITLTLEVINLNDEEEHGTFGRDPLSLERVARTGRFVSLGLRGSF